MKKGFNRTFAMLMTFILAVSMVWNMDIAKVQAAATPTFAKTNVEIVGTGETYQLEVKNKVSKSTYKWTSSNASVATVSNKGVITSKNKGIATIKCKITYPTKRTKTLSCKVTVTIPATDIEINNANLTNGAHILSLGSSMDFNTTLTPSTSSDQVYWSLVGGDKACVRIDDALNGKITAIKAGKVILNATAVKTVSQAAVDASIVNDAVIVEVVGPTATVKSADITESNKITVVFDSAVDATTVITNGTLSDNIELTLRKDTKGVLGAEPGTMTATLSEDKKTLTIITKNTLNGNYGINFSSNIKTADGLALETYYKQLTYSDNSAPYILQTTVDDSGLIATIQFNEEINFDNMKVFGATTVASGVTANATTISILNNVMKYQISADKRSLKIDLTEIVEADKGKLFSVYISGIKDKTGNIPSNVYVTAYIQTDNSIKPQARVLTIRRTGFSTLTATFDRAVRSGGVLSIAGGTILTGVVDSTNNKQVNFTMTAAESLTTGYKTVTIGYWTGYNVAPTDTSANSMQTYYVDFTADTTKPVVTDYKYDAETGILTMNFSKDVTTLATNGIFNCSFASSTDEIKPNVNINYALIAHTEGNKVIKLKITNMSLIGSYSFTINEGFVWDNYKNTNLIKSITISNATGTSTELPEPYNISQSLTNPDQIYVRFAHKLDIASATSLSHYVIPGVTFIKAEIETNTSEAGAVVILTIAPDSVAVTVSRPMTIRGVKGYNNSFTAITSYQTTVDIKENKRPGYLSTTFDSVTKNTIKLNFDEAIQGTLIVRVIQVNGTSSIEYPNTVTMSGSTANIQLTNIPMLGSYLKVEILTNNVTDLSGNAVKPMAATLGTVVTY